MVSKQAKSKSNSCKIANVGIYVEKAHDSVSPSINLLWELNITDKLLIIHVLEEVYSFLVGKVLAIMVKDVEMDESWEKTNKYQGVEETVP